MEKISDRQISSVTALVIISGILMSGGSDRSMQNGWIAQSVAIALTVPIYVMYSRIVSLFPGKGLFEIIIHIWGKYVGKTVIFLLSIYAFFVGAMGMRIFSEFNQVVSMPETSQMLTLVIFGAVCIYVMKKGVASLGAFSNIALPLIVLMFLVINIFSLGDWKLHYAMPIMHNIGGEFARDVVITSVFPLGEAVLVCTLFGFKKEKGGARKILLTGLAIGGILLVLETLRCIMVLGANTISLLYYPSYTATGIINFRDFFTRVEVMISASFFVAQIVKTTLCVYVFCSGIGRIIEGTDYKSLICPTVFIMVATAFIMFGSTVEAYEFLDVYKFFAPAFQFVLPFILWVFAEIKSYGERKLEDIIVTD